jgi:hypothetical protein
VPGSTVGFRRSALHLTALWALAFVQPMFGLLGDRAGAEFFVARGNTTFDIVLFAVGYAFVPPLLGAGLVWLAGRIRPALSWGVHLTLVALLAAALILPPLGDAFGGSAVSIAVALAVGAGFAYLYVRANAVRSFLSILAAAPLVFLLLFLVFSPVSDLLNAGEASAASVDGPARSSTPIVHIVLDELPVSTLVNAKGQIDAELYPNLAKFAAGATWYRNATTVADSTPEAVPAQLTGQRPQAGDLPTPTTHSHSLFTLFGRSHAFSVAEPVTDVCPADLCPEPGPPVRARLSALADDLTIVAEHLLLPDDLRDGLPAIDRGWLGFGSESGTGEIAGMTARGSRAKLLGRVIERIDADDARVDFARVEETLDRPTSRPWLVFMHSTLPHGPSRFLPDGHGYTVNRSNYPGLAEGRWVGPQWLMDHNFERHVLQTMYTDVLVGELFDKLHEKGIYDKAAIVLTADHGEAFLTGEPRRRISAGNISDIAVVPFFVKLPGQREGALDDRPVLTVDALPTLAKAAGVDVPWKTDGMPVDERPAGSDDPITLFDDGAQGDEYPAADVRAGFRDRQAYERRILRRGPYGIGPRPDLLGEQVEQTGSEQGGDPSALIDGASDYADVDTDAAALPTLVSGAVSGLPEDTPLAIAVNGRVEATTRVFNERGEDQFVAMVPPDTLRAGENTVTVLQVLADDRLQVIGWAPF